MVLKVALSNEGLELCDACALFSTDAEAVFTDKRCGRKINFIVNG